MDIQFDTAVKRSLKPVLSTSTKDDSNTTDMAIVTHVCDASWAPGALALGASLKRAGTKYNLVLLVTSTLALNLVQMSTFRMFLCSDSSDAAHCAGLCRARAISRAIARVIKW